MGLKWTTQRTIRKLIEAGETFQLGNIHAEVYERGEWPQFGRMAQIECDRLKDTVDGQIRTYVVYSYETPIGWTTPTGWYMPDKDYTVTTKHHKNVLKSAIQ